MKELGNGPWNKGYQPSGISKAQEAAFKVYPYESGVKGLICENSRQLFIQGYEQAEKDLELSWEDMKEIVRIADGMMNMADSLADTEKRLGVQPYYTEVLTRFKQFKEAKK